MTIQPIAALRALADRCEAAIEPDRYLDADIFLETGEFARQRFASPEMLNRAYVHRLAFVGGVPKFTDSLDVAVSLVPEGWFWRVGRTTLFSGWAVVNQTHPDHCDPDREEFFSNCEWWKPLQLPPVRCLLACALRARASVAFQREERQRTKDEGKAS